jgi:cyclic pyranopterin phosphate synthase
MDPYVTGADTDLVVAEGSSPRRGLGNFKIRPTGSNRLGQAVPLHLLQSNMPSYSGARLYSSSTSLSPPRSSDEQTSEEIPSNDGPSLTPTPTTTDGHESGFASLRGLFGNPKRSWSSPQASNHETDAIDQSNEPDREITSSNNVVNDDPFEDHPNNLFLNAEKEHAKAQVHERQSLGFYDELFGAAPASQSSEQLGEKDDASIVSNPTPPDKLDSLERSPDFHSTGILPPPLRIRKDFSIPSSRKNDLAFEKHLKKTTKAVDTTGKAPVVAKGPRPPKPKPLPVWKVDSDDVKLPSQRVDTSTMSVSTKPRQPLQSNAQPSTSPTIENVEQSPYDQQPFASPDNSIEEPPSTHHSNLETNASLTHLTSTGEAHMVDVGQKESTERVAVAVGFVHFGNKEPYRLIKENLNKKGDVLGVARIAGIMAAKRCSDIIPLCHPIPITKITLDVGTISPGRAFGLLKGNVTRYGVVAVEARVHTRGQTGVEMEALTAVSGACLTVYDMCKAVDKDMVINGARVLYKAGGKSGVFLEEKFKDHSVNERFIKME